MFEFLANANPVGSAIAGGISGLVGSIFNGIMGYFKDKQANLHELKMAEVQERIMDKEYRVAQLETSAELEKEENQVIKAAYEHDSSLMEGLASKVKMGPMLSAVVVGISAFRAFTRPGITWALYISSILMFLKAWAVVGSEMDLQTATYIVQSLVNLTIYGFTTALVFWFGTRFKPQKKGE